jgi:hypothetical protein
MKKYIVELTMDERKQLKKKELIRCGKAEAYKIRHAQIMLKTDQAEGRTAWKDKVA